MSSYEQYLSSLRKIMLWLYNEEVLSEDAIIQWYAGAEGLIRTTAEPFVKWLQEAEEESD